MASRLLKYKQQRERVRLEGGEVLSGTRRVVDGLSTRRYNAPSFSFAWGNHVLRALRNQSRVQISIGLHGSGCNYNIKPIEMGLAEAGEARV